MHAASPRVITYIDRRKNKRHNALFFFFLVGVDRVVVDVGALYCLLWFCSLCHEDVAVLRWEDFTQIGNIGSL